MSNTPMSKYYIGVRC